SNTRSRTGRTTEDHRSAHLSAGHIKRLGSRVHDLVDCLHGKVEGHELNDRTQTCKSSPYTYTGETMFGDRGIDNALGTEFVEKSLRYLVSALIFGNFFTHNENARVAAHFFGHRITKRFTNSRRNH